MKDNLRKVEGFRVQGWFPADCADERRLGNLPSPRLCRTGGKKAKNDFLQNKANLKSLESPDFMGLGWRFWGLKNKANQPNLKPKKAILDPIKADFGHCKGVSKPFHFARRTRRWRRGIIKFEPPHVGSYNRNAVKPVRPVYLRKWLEFGTGSKSVKPGQTNFSKQGTGRTTGGIGLYHCSTKPLRNN